MIDPTTTPPPGSPAGLPMPERSSGGDYRSQLALTFDDPNQPAKPTNQ